MTPGFATARLDVAPVDPGQIAAGDLAAIATPAVTAHLPTDLIVTSATQDAQHWLKRLMAGGDVFAVRQDGPVVGFLTLHRARDDHWMLGYLFAETAWGQGLASELVSGLIAHLKQANWRGTLSGGVAPDNPASARVLVKAGFAQAEPPFYHLVL